MELVEPVRRFVRWYIGGIRDLLTGKADRIRARTYGWQETIRREHSDIADQDGLEKYLTKRSAPALAWADFLDALAGRRS